MTSYIYPKTSYIIKCTLEKNLNIENLRNYYENLHSCIVQRLCLADLVELLLAEPLVLRVRHARVIQVQVIPEWKMLLLSLLWRRVK